jgi:hypothetical protein
MAIRSQFHRSELCVYFGHLADIACASVPDTLAIVSSRMQHVHVTATTQFAKRSARPSMLRKFQCRKFPSAMSFA